jgi:hypothetical protein
MMGIRFAVLAVTILLASGCTSSKMAASTEQTFKVPPADKAQIIFLRPSAFGGAIQASVFDVTESEPEFIGIVSTGAKVSYMVDPGKRTFMVVSEAADFLEANLDAATTYFAVVTARMGAWKARFSLFPVRNGGEGEYQYDSEKFQSWLAKTKFYENTPEAVAWSEQNMTNIIKKQEKYWPVWKDKTPEALSERTLNAEDGI